MKLKLQDLWHRQPRTLILAVGAIPLTLGFFVFTWLMVVPPQLAAASVNQASSNINVLKPLELTFIAPLSRRSFQATIEPTLEGEWQWDDGTANHLQRTVQFVPAAQWQSDQEYTATITAQNLLENKQNVIVYKFHTQKIPAVSAVSVAGASSVSPTEPIEVSFDTSTKGFGDYQFSLEPTAALTVNVSADGQRYSLLPQSPLAFGQQYLLTVEQQLTTSKQKIFSTQFQTKLPAELISFTPQGSSVLPGSSIELTFKEAMNRQSVEQNTQIAPPLAGSWQWLSDTRTRFVPTKALEMATTYQLTLGKSALAQSGVTFKADVVQSFKTVGNLIVTKTSPAPGQSGVPRTTTISITFDQPVNRAAVEAAWSSSPTLAGRFSWSNQTLSFTPSQALEYYAAYQVTLATSAQSELGKPLSNPYSFRFTTEEKTVLLDIPWDHQDRALSCEAAALKMALRYKNVFVSEDEIMSIVGYDPTIRSGDTWGDPDQAFVGNINGSQNSTGYGVYWGPIARAARAYRSAEAFSGWTVAQAAHQLEAGNPLVIWGTLGSAKADSWRTPSGRAVTALKGEHARTLIGFKGSSDNPSSFIINDPIVGRVTWSVSKFKSNWATFNNSGVVVY